jgi:hypothetical protein
MGPSAFGEFDEFRINYGEGLTPTEQLLKFFGERSFLRFWSHANPHVTPTQELCDLLVVCGDYVFIFSDKGVNYQPHRDEQVAWRQWYREAIKESLKQLKGAVRSLFVLQATIYKDKTCTVPLGLPLPSPERAKVYRVAVGSLTKEGDDSVLRQPFLTIDGGIAGDEHGDDDATPFRLGDVSPDTDFVHVFDFAGVWAVLAELDTVTDFARYLDARKAFIRGGGRNSAATEWCLLTRYLLSFTNDGDPLPLDSANPGFTRLGDGERQAESTKAALRTRKEANRDSYLWDSLIKRQAEMVEQRSFEYSTYSSVQDTERVVRHMALEARLNRRMLSKMWKEACLIAAPGQTINLRTAPHGRDNATTYLFLTMAQPEGMPNDQYRSYRCELLKQLVLASLIDYPTTKIVIGFSSELGQIPDSRDHLCFNVEEGAHAETLPADATAAWEFKRRILGDPKHSVITERDIPPTR